MYLGIVSSIVTKSNDQKVEEYKLVSFCNKANKIEKFALKNANKFKIGDLLLVKIDEDGVYNFEKISDLFFYEISKSHENILFQLFKLMDKEISNFKNEKEKEEQEIKKLEITDLALINCLCNVFGNFRARETAIKSNINKFISLARILEQDLNDVKKYSEIQCMKIIMETGVYPFDFEKWLNSVALILCLSNNNNINEELLIRTIEALLNVKIANNETNELKLQLEQQLKGKLHELKGKQKKLV